MKKFLLFAIAFLGISSVASADQLTFYYNGAAVAPGSTIEHAGYEIYDYTSTQDEAFMDPMIFLGSDVNGTVAMKTTSNFPVQLCIGGDCQASQEIEKDDLVFEAGKQQNLLLDCSYFFDKGTEPVLPAIEVTIEAWYVNKPNVKTTIYLKMGSAAGVESVIADENAAPVYYNLQGVRVENPQSGLYIYRQGRKTGKILVK